MGEAYVTGPRLGTNVAEFYGLPGLVDVRKSMPWENTNGPKGFVPLSQKRGVTVHYNGPPMETGGDPVRLLQGIASYHIAKNWGSASSPAFGNGIMYHVAVPADGSLLLVRTIERVAWHAGISSLNSYALAVFVPIGDGQRVTAAQRSALARLCDAWIAGGHGSRSDVRGHGEVSSTSCPGSVLDDFVLPYRAGGIATVAERLWFSETGHGIGGGFLTFWRENGGVRTFGYPLTDEFDVRAADAPNGRRTVQVFERAVLEWHPEADAAWQVVGRRLGADALEAVLRERV